jgi:hypothetical protein
VKFYIQGPTPRVWSLPGHPEVGYAVQWETSECEDGTYYFETRAWDRSGNMGISEILSVRVWNDRPRVIWVPDDFETIQTAAFASKDGDTIMVRPGTYREWVNLFDRRISLISEAGPEVTFIDGTHLNLGLEITGGQDSSTVIRGFTFVKNSGASCLAITGSSPLIVNNVFTGPDGINDGNYGIWTDENVAVIRNNLMIDIYTGAYIGHGWGDFSNNMIISTVYAFWNRPNEGQQLRPDYNLIWDYQTFLGGSQVIEFGDNNIIDENPLFEAGSYRLREGSPAIDTGNPQIQDSDGSRSDIGVFGGPYAY